jgi:hypothetical protein
MPTHKTYIDTAERWLGDTELKDSAQVYATLAVAEQLKRIADALDYHIQWNVDANWPRKTEAEPDEMTAEHQDNRRRAREWMDGNRRGMGLNTDDLAEARTDYADPLN